MTSSIRRLLHAFVLLAPFGAAAVLVAEEAPRIAPASPATDHATSLGAVAIGAGVIGLLLLLEAVRRFARTSMQRWTVARRLGFGFASILTVLVALAAESYVSLHTALYDFEHYRADAVRTNLATGMQIEFLEMNAASRDLVLTRDAQQGERHALHHQKMLALLGQAQRKIEEPELHDRIRLITTEVGVYAGLHAELLAAVRTDNGPAIADLTTRMGALGETIDHQAEAMETAFLARQNSDGPRMAAELAHTQSAVVWLGLAAIALGAGLAVIISASIGGPLRTLAAALGAGAEQTAAAAGQVSASSQSLAEGASEQAASLEETSASLEEMNSMTRRNADNSLGAQQVASETSTAALTGTEQMSAMQSAMERINAASKDITKVLKTIDEIAFQTNILALNAAIEAARAGEQGAGFAVVAEEVRALAQRSAGAARETASMIERSVTESKHGVEISAEVARSLEGIQGRVQKLDQLVTEIASASGEQSKGIEQITQAVAQMDQVTQSNAGSAEETAAAAEELNGQSVMLKEAVEQLQALTGARSAVKTAKPGGAAGPRKTATHQAPARELVAAWR